MAKEVLFDVDSFNTPKVLEGADANAQLLYNALMCSRDTRITQGIAYEIRRFRFEELKTAISTIENTLRDYCTQYIPDIYVSSIKTHARTSTSILLSIEIIDETTKDNRNIIFSVEEKNSKLLVDLIKD